jgi:hypothetical protein
VCTKIEFFCKIQGQKQYRKMTARGSPSVANQTIEPMKFMKTKLLLTAALIGAATLSAQAGVHFGFSFGLPVPFVAPVVVAPPVVAVSPVVLAAPACPGPGYIWAPGYWSVTGYGRAWVPGCWRGGYGYGYGYGHAGWGHGYGWRR